MPIKLVIYNLPPTLKESTFWESVQEFAPLFGYKYFCAGKIGFIRYFPFYLETKSSSTRKKTPSRAYITFPTFEAVTAFSQFCQGKQYSAEGSGEWKGFFTIVYCNSFLAPLLASVEIAPNQLLPEQPKPHKHDLLREGTLMKGCYSWLNHYHCYFSYISYKCRSRLPSFS